MNALQQQVKTLKKKFSPPLQNPAQPARCWSEKDALHDNIVDAFVMILRTRGCSWSLSSGCTMCGYFNDSLWKPVSEKDLLQQVDTALSQYTGEPLIKIFTSGSFFDDDEISPSVRKNIIEKVGKHAEKISVESRPEYITEDRLSIVREGMQDQLFEIGIGLETAHDGIRECAINKGFQFTDYKKAVDLMKKHQILVKTYVLIKPPFLTEQEAIDDCVSTVKRIKNCTDMVSFNPTNVQRHTLVEYLWKRKQYRPAWLWSVTKILEESRKLLPSTVRMKCDIAGGGSVRGAHNCGVCDNQVLKASTTVSLTQDTQVFDDLHCSCRETWLDQRDLEPLGFGSLIDLSRRYT